MGSMSLGLTAAGTQGGRGWFEFEVGGGSIFGFREGGWSSSSSSRVRQRHSFEGGGSSSSSSEEID